MTDSNPLTNGMGHVAAVLLTDDVNRERARSEAAIEQGRAAARRVEFWEGLRHLVNYTGMDAQLNVPDYILADYLASCMTTFALAVSDRDTWFGFDPRKAFEVEPTGPALDKVAPELLTALSTLFNEYGPLGVVQVAQKMQAGG